MKQIIKYTSLITIILLLGSGFAFADGGTISDPPDDSLDLGNLDPLGNITVSELIGRIVSFAIGLIIAISVLFILYAAYLFMFAGGDPKNVTQARNIILYTVIAIVVALMSQVMVSIVIDVLGGERQVDASRFIK